MWDVGIRSFLFDGQSRYLLIQCSFRKFVAVHAPPLLPDSRWLAPEVRQIVQAVCSYYQIDEPKLFKSRRGRFNEPRAMAIHLIRKMRNDSYAEIGSAFGLGSYSAVGGVLDSMRKRLALDLELAERCRFIRESLMTGQTDPTNLRSFRRPRMRLMEIT